MPLLYAFRSKVYQFNSVNTLLLYELHYSIFDTVSENVLEFSFIMLTTAVVVECS